MRFFVDENQVGKPIQTIPDIDTRWNLDPIVLGKTVFKKI